MKPEISEFDIMCCVGADILLHLGRGFQLRIVVMILGRMVVYNSEVGESRVARGFQV